MFIKKSKYQEKLQLIDGLKKMNSDKYNEIQDLQLKISDLEGQNNSLSSYFGKLQEENQKLINWIERIINDLGAYEIPEDNAIRIPIYKRKMYEETNMGDVEEVILPQVTYMLVKKIKRSK